MGSQCVVVFVEQYRHARQGHRGFGDVFSVIQADANNLPGIGEQLPVLDAGLIKQGWLELCAIAGGSDLGQRGGIAVAQQFIECQWRLDSQQVRRLAHVDHAASGFYAERLTAIGIGNRQQGKAFGHLVRPGIFLVVRLLFGTCLCRYA